LLCLFVSEEKSQITEHVLWAMAAFFLGFTLPVFPTLVIWIRRHMTNTTWGQKWQIRSIFIFEFNEYVSGNIKYIRLVWLQTKY